jgi:hypothetical protein
LTKLDKRDAEVLKVIRAHVGAGDTFTAPSIIGQCVGLAAKKNPALVAGVGRISSKSLGHTLKRCQGAVVDEHRLCFHYSAKGDRWVYWFEPWPFPEARGLTADEMDQRYKVLKSTKFKIAENRRQLQAIDEREAKKMEAQPGPSLTITEVPAPAEPAPEPEYQFSEWTDSEGRQHKKLLIDPRTGEPIRRRPEAQAPAAPPAVEVAPAATVGPPELGPWVGRNRNGDPIMKRQPTRAELAARHHQSNHAQPTYNGGWGTGHPITPYRRHIDL